MTSQPQQPPAHHGEEPSRIDYLEVENSADFKALKKQHRSFVFPLAVFFLLWYFAYVLLGAYAHDFMATPVFGFTNVGILLGLGQFVTTFVITMAYVSFANRKIDPGSAAIRARLEAQEGQA